MVHFLVLLLTLSPFLLAGLLAWVLFCFGLPLWLVGVLSVVGLQVLCKLCGPVVHAVVTWDLRRVQKF